MSFYIDSYWPKEPGASGRDVNSLWFHSEKVDKAKRINIGDRVLLYETNKHPDHSDWHGQKKVFASATVSGLLEQVVGSRIVGGKNWEYRIPLKIDIIVDRERGVEWDRVRQVLDWKSGSALRSGPTSITESKFREIENHLRILAGDDERDEAFEDIIEREVVEGRRTIKTHIAYERDRRAVAYVKSEMMKKHGKLFCKICGFSFEARYGKLGRYIIDIHHKIPLSELTPDTKITNSDLIPICANCHRIIHSKRPCLSVQDLRPIIDGHKVEDTGSIEKSS